jgi:hypothetical protein
MAPRFTFQLVVSRNAPPSVLFLETVARKGPK